jgi:hypothetical protein
VIDLHVEGVGLAGAAADPAPAGAPALEVLPAALRRRATPLARLVAEAAARAAAAAGADLATLPVVLGSAFGEIAIAVEMMASFREPGGLPSPTKFHNSVHNAAAAYLGIAAQNRGFATALAAGAETPAVALLEAATLLRAGAPRVLVVVADEPVPAPFARPAPWAAAAAAFVVAAEAGPRARARLSSLRRGEAPAAPLPPALAAHPCAGGFALAAALAAGEAATVALGGGAAGWAADLAPLETR